MDPRAGIGASGCGRTIRPTGANKRNWPRNSRRIARSYQIGLKVKLKRVGIGISRAGRRNRRWLSTYRAPRGPSPHLQMHFSTYASASLLALAATLVSVSIPQSGASPLLVPDPALSPPPAVAPPPPPPPRTCSHAPPRRNRTFPQRKRKYNVTVQRRRAGGPRKKSSRAALAPAQRHMHVSCIVKWVGFG